MVVSSGFKGKILPTKQGAERLWKTPGSNFQVPHVHMCLPRQVHQLSYKHAYTQAHTKINLVTLKEERIYTFCR